MKIQVGIVSSIDESNCTARVQFDESDGVVSGPLRIVVRGSLSNKDYWMPKVEEHVLCSFTKGSEGFILGAIYSDASPPPVNSSTKRHIAFEDGTTLEYDTGSQTLSINCVGTINIVASGNVNVTGDVIADGISLKDHTHTGQDGDTSPPK